MAERIKLPKNSRSADFFAEFTLKDDGDEIIATEGWIEAPKRRDEMMEIVQVELTNIAHERGKKVVHKYEAATRGGKLLVQRTDGYKYFDRTPDGNSIYIKEFNSDL